MEPSYIEICSSIDLNEEPMALNIEDSALAFGNSP